jgi:hypothetical protein
MHEQKSLPGWPWKHDITLFRCQTIQPVFGGRGQTDYTIVEKAFKDGMRDLEAIRDVEGCR